MKQNNSFGVLCVKKSKDKSFAFANKSRNAFCEDRTHDLQIMRLTLYRLS